MNIIEGIVGAISGGRRAPAPSTETPSAAPIGGGGENPALTKRVTLPPGEVAALLENEEFLALPDGERMARLKKLVPGYLPTPPLSFGVEFIRRAGPDAIIDAEDVAKLAALQRRFDELTALAAEVATTRVREQVAAQRGEMIADLQRGDFEKFKKRDAWTREEFETERRLKIQALKGQRRALAKEILPLARTAAVNTVRCAMKLRRDEAQATAAQLAAWGLSYLPSAIETALVRIAIEAITGLPEENTTVEPKAVAILAPFLQSQPVAVP